MSGRILLIAVVLAIAIGGGFSTYVMFRDRAPATPGATASSRSSRETGVPPSPATVPRSETTPIAPRAARKPATAAEASAPDATAPELGTLRIEADVPNAQVFLDRQFIGNAPVTAEHVKPGTHTLNVSAEGFDSVAQTLDVEPGPREVAIRFKEVRLDATLAVVHKHRIGSCKGQLVATPQGLRYETDDKDDRFTASLGDLEQFVVDYLDKNLKVKVRKGKQYNFTDPDGNADRLFVFQRDVDKVRQRLAKGDTAATN
ncbi:MAG TPA: PEGA domain-containing protein [Vicinamibacterales bacterium]